MSNTEERPIDLLYARIESSGIHDCLLEVPSYHRPAYGSTRYPDRELRSAC